MKSLIVKTFLGLVFFMGSAMLPAPVADRYYGACDVYPEGVMVTVLSQPANSEITCGINGNRFEFSCNKPGDYYVRFYKDGYKEKLQKFCVTEDAFTMYGDVRLDRQPDL